MTRNCKITNPCNIFVDWSIFTKKDGKFPKVSKITPRGCKFPKVGKITAQSSKFPMNIKFSADGKITKKLKWLPYNLS